VYDERDVLFPSAVTKDINSRFAGDCLKCYMSSMLKMNRFGLDKTAAFDMIVQ
jgi:hypothetical protein